MSFQQISKRKVFLDCGTNLGQGFQQFIELGKIDSETEVYCFEPNPCCEIDKEKLEKIAESLSVFPKIQFYQAAVFNEEKTAKVFIRKDHQHNAATCLEEIGNSETSRFKNIGGHSVEVNAIRLLSFIENLGLSENDELRIKLDIEGSEFFVLLDMASNFKNWHLLKEVWVEWHERFMHKFDASSRKSIEKTFKDNGVEILEWH